MKKKWITVLLWILAFILTAVIFVYQRLTGPTHPVRASESIKGKIISYRLLRSYTKFKNMPVKISVSDKNIKAWLNYKRYKTNDEWAEIEMTRDAEKKEILKGEIPGQPAAGKVEYTIRVQVDGEDVLINNGKSIVARFKGEVPAVFLIAHIVFMFLSILFALRTGMETLRKEGNYSWMVNWTLGIVFIGGLILGPIVQKYAFGDLWTGFPFGFDLTDNKVLIAFIFWLAAFFLKKKSKWWVGLATVVMIIIYLIPHSVLGSELDYKSGQMKNKYAAVLLEDATGLHHFLKKHEILNPKPETNPLLNL
jgi:ABC-type multidrug transport system fused ATPase/permease subunit